jgi:hypothetical protein
MAVKPTTCKVSIGKEWHVLSCAAPPFRIDSFLFRLVLKSTKDDQIVVVEGI